MPVNLTLVFTVSFIDNIWTNNEVASFKYHPRITITGIAIKGRALQTSCCIYVHLYTGNLINESNFHLLLCVCYIGGGIFYLFCYWGIIL